MRTVVVGIGNDFRGDDGAGRETVRLLRTSHPKGVEFIELNGEMMGLLDRLDDCSTLIVIDATQSQSPAGTIHRFDAGKNPLPDNRGQRSTHGISIGSVIEMARVQHLLPRRVLVFGIEGETFDHGTPLTPRVKDAVRNLADEIARDLGSDAR